MDGASSTIVLGRSDPSPFRDSGSDIERHVGFQGFWKAQPDVEEELLNDAVAEVDKLDSDSQLHVPAEVIVDGFLGDEGSCRIAEIQSFDDNTTTLQKFDECLEGVSVAVNSYMGSLGFAKYERSPMVVHRGGLDMGVPSDMTVEELEKFISVFGRHVLMIMLFLGPGEGTLELEPFDDEAETQEIRTKPGTVVVLRADLMAHRHVPDGDDTVLTSWILIPAQASARSAEPKLFQTPIQAQLRALVADKMQEAKAMETLDQTASEKMTLAMQMEMNRLIWSGPRAAVRGIGIRGPGAFEAQYLWQGLTAGPDFVTEVPLARWDHSSYYDPRPESYEQTSSGEFKIKTNINHCCFIEGAELFDAAFFDLKREAWITSVDQRLTLECAYEAMNQSGYTKKTLKEAYLGTFMATGSILWALTERCDKASGFGLGGSTVSAARTSYVLGMRGPCMTFDTEGSASLTSTIMAAQSVVSTDDRWSGAGMDCPHSVAGGSLMVTAPNIWPRYGCWMDPVGRTFVFDDCAKGHVQGEGVVMICVGGLTQKVDGKPVIKEAADRGALAGWRINSNGINAGGMTAPNGAQQQDCIQMSFRQAGINAWDVDAVECHGAASLLEDAIEVTSLAMVLRGEERAENEVLHIGAMKTNTGNMIEVAGAAAIVKIVYCQQYAIHTPNLHLRVLNPDIDTDDLPLHMQTENLTYRALGSYHGLTCRSQNGTNAHVLLWGNVNQKRIDVTPKSTSAQGVCYWPGGGGKLEPGARAMIGYSIAGSWNGWEGSADMVQEASNLYTHTLTIGENGFEEFQIWLDGDQTKALCRGGVEVTQGSAVYGPVLAEEGAPFVISDGKPGDRYEVRLNISGKFRGLTWEKVFAVSSADQMRISGTYQVTGSFSDWTLIEMKSIEERRTQWSVDVGPLMTAQATFNIIRNRDWHQTFYPSAGQVVGPVVCDWRMTQFELPNLVGEKYRIKLRRFLDFDRNELEVTWEKL